MPLELFDFQQQAVNQLVAATIQYFAGGVDRAGGRNLPFVGQLKAITGAGKTPILASVIGQLAPAIILWTTKFGAVVEQTVANLRASGKYHHLLGNKPVSVVRFSDIPDATAWEYILAREDGLTVIVSTVAAWYSSEKDDRLNVHRIHRDWGEISRWEQLKRERKRPLWIVYDEAHNTTTEQVEMLDDLDPAGFFVASASPVKGKLAGYLSLLPSEVRQQRIAPVSTRAVVDQQLLKSTIALTDYDSDTEAMILEAAARRDSLELAMRAAGGKIVPKAIYVVEKSDTTSSRESRPVAIWNTLVKQGGVDPTHIAVCTDTKKLPADAVRVATISALAPTYTHHF